MTLSSQNIAQMSVTERLELIGKIWDSLETEAEKIMFTPAQCAELKRRMEAHTRDPEAGETWEEVRATLK